MKYDYFLLTFKLFFLGKKNIYTGQGDKGMTSLIGGLQVSKTNLRLEAYGTVDELNAFIGLLIAEIMDSSVIDLLKWVQYQLFSIGACLATDTDQTTLKPTWLITPSMIQQLEQGIDMFHSKLPEIKGFVLPGGCRSASLAHICRTVCRRAEREIFRLKDIVSIDDAVCVFINRLSDLLYVIAINENFYNNENENFSDKI